MSASDVLGATTGFFDASVNDLQVNGQLSVTANSPSRGTWTPQLQFAGSSTGVTTTSPTFGEFLDLGSVVWISGGITLSSKGSHGSSDIASIVGLPVTPGIGLPVSTLSVGWSNISFTLTAPSVSLHVVPSANAISVEQSGSNAAEANLTYSSFSDNSQLLFSGFYFAA